MIKRFIKEEVSDNVKEMFTSIFDLPSETEADKLIKDLNLNLGDYTKLSMFVNNKDINGFKKFILGDNMRKQTITNYLSKNNVQEQYIKPEDRKNAKSYYSDEETAYGHVMDRRGKARMIGPRGETKGTDSSYKEPSPYKIKENIFDVNDPWDISFEKLLEDEKDPNEELIEKTNDTDKLLDLYDEFYGRYMSEEAAERGYNAKASQYWEKLSYTTFVKLKKMGINPDDRYKKEYKYDDPTYKEFVNSVDYNGAISSPWNNYYVMLDNNKNGTFDLSYRKKNDKESISVGKNMSPDETKEKIEQMYKIVSNLKEAQLPSMGDAMANKVAFTQDEKMLKQKQYVEQEALELKQAEEKKMLALKQKQELEAQKEIEQIVKLSMLEPNQNINLTVSGPEIVDLEEPKEKVKITKISRNPTTGQSTLFSQGNEVLTTDGSMTELENQFIDSILNGTNDSYMYDGSCLDTMQMKVNKPMPRTNNIIGGIHEAPINPIKPIEPIQKKTDPIQQKKQAMDFKKLNMNPNKDITITKDNTSIDADFLGYDEKSNAVVVKNPDKSIEITTPDKVAIKENDIRSLMNVIEAAEKTFTFENGYEYGQVDAWKGGKLKDQTEVYGEEYNNGYIKGWNEIVSKGELGKGSVAEDFNSLYKSESGFIDMRNGLGYIDLKYHFNGEEIDDNPNNSYVNVILSDQNDNVIIDDDFYVKDFDKFLEKYGIYEYSKNRMGGGKGIEIENHLTHFLDEYNNYHKKANQ